MIGQWLESSSTTIGILRPSLAYSTAHGAPQTDGKSDCGCTEQSIPQGNDWGLAGEFMLWETKKTSLSVSEAASMGLPSFLYTCRQLSHPMAYAFALQKLHIRHFLPSSRYKFSFSQACYKGGQSRGFCRLLLTML